MICKSLLQLQSISYGNHHIIVTCGKYGVFIASKNVHLNYSFSFIKAVATTNIVNTSGAGDTLTGAFIYHLLKKQNIDNFKQVTHIQLQKSIKMAVQCASQTIQCTASVSPTLKHFYNPSQSHRSHL